MPTSPNEDGRPTAGGAAQPVHIMNPGAISGGGGGGGGSQSVTVVELPDATPTADGEANPNTTRVGSLNYGYNGSTWDRLRTAIGDAMAATGLLGFVTMLWNGATYDRLKGDNTGAARVSLYGQNSAAGDTALKASSSGVLRVSPVTDTNLAVPANIASDAISFSANSLPVGGSLISLYNPASTNWERQRPNYEVTALASAARTASINSADLTNYNSRGVIVVVDVTALTATGTLTVTINGKSTLSGKYYPILTGAVLVATGTTVMVVYPGQTVVANLDASTPLPRIWQVQVVAGNGVSITYSIDANYIL